MSAKREITHIASPLLTSGRSNPNYQPYAAAMTADAATRDGWVVWQPQIMFNAGLATGDGGSPQGTGALSFGNSATNTGLRLSTVSIASGPAESTGSLTAIGTGVTSVEYDMSTVDIDPIIYQGSYGRSNNSGSFFFGFTTATTPGSNSPLDTSFLDDVLATTFASLGFYAAGGSTSLRLVIKGAGVDPTSDPYVDQTVLTSWTFNTYAHIAMIVHKGYVWLRIKRNDETDYTELRIDDIADNRIADMGKMAANMTAKSVVDGSSYFLKVLGAQVTQRRRNGTEVFPVTS